MTHATTTAAATALALGLALATATGAQAAAPGTSTSSSATGAAVHAASVDPAGSAILVPRCIPHKYCGRHHHG
ncbi:hypothetical protein BFL34_01307 [Clavibacter michiganensis]|uniref:Uncharacterized protein n=1 Tax=Clavibacter michiganensis TaxID=28447 RepID=A0A251Y886_9MICO|nr:hypothetical protein [Clavibacter michiganensis]OUE20492.1 hypothetical protein BFL34_01307 [Clavibacter michiganensis]